MSESMVQIRSVTKTYERGKQKVEVLHEIGEHTSELQSP